MAKTKARVGNAEKSASGKPDQKSQSWFDELVTVFTAGISHVFLVHGDINGLVTNPKDKEDDPDEPPFIPLKKFWEKAFDQRKMVIFYNIASGIRFLDKKMEAVFKKIAGLDEPAAGKDPIAAAKAELAAKRGIPREPELALPLIEKVLKESESAALVINSVHFIAPSGIGGTGLLPPERANVERLRNWIQDEKIRDNGNIVILMTDFASKVSTELKQAGSGITQIHIPKPTKDQRRDFIKFLSKKYKGNLDKSFSTEVFAHATQGMDLQQILDIFLYAGKTGEPIDTSYVKTKKREILNNEYGDVMEIVEAESGLDDVGGLGHVKNYFLSILNAIKSGESRLVPMGVTLAGPPGTGKTKLVEALAKEAGFNFVKIRNIRSMWLGESENRQEKMIFGLRSLAPVVVMNDEADLNEADRDSPKGDSGVSERLMKMWMEFLSDPKIRGQVIVISCTNRPDRIDPALKRSGRSDEIILIPMPSEPEVIEIFRVMFKRHKIPTDIKDFKSFAPLVSGFSGANIEKISLDSFKFAFAAKNRIVDEATLKSAIEDFIPSASQADIDRMTILSILECSSRRLLPPNIKEIILGIKKRNLIKNLPDILDQIRERNIATIDEEE